jgi:predicted amidohydrolase YtcJ
MTHAIGNAANHMVLDAYAQLEELNGPKDRRLRIEHASAIIPDDIPKFKTLSVIPDMQPAFCCGPDNSEQKQNQWQSLIKAGAQLAFSSDWPCSWPPDPYQGIQETVLRTIRRFGANATSTLEYSLPEERLTVEQALAAYTRASTYARFSEKKLGTLETGKDADLVVLSQDLFAVAPTEIGKTRALMTMVGGKIVFDQMN